MPVKMRKTIRRIKGESEPNEAVTFPLGSYPYKVSGNLRQDGFSSGQSMGANSTLHVRNCVSHIKLLQYPGSYKDITVLPYSVTEFF